MKQIVRVACCLLALVFFLPSFAQNADDGVITTEEMKERLATVESDGSVITTDKMKERLEGEEAAAAAAAFTNKDLGSTGDSEEGEGEKADPSAEAQAEADPERERLIAEIEAELDALAERVRSLEGETDDDTRLRETDDKLEELRRAVESLKKDE